MISPQAEGSGYVLTRVLPPLALRFPIFISAGAKDAASKDAAEAVRKDLDRNRSNKIEIFPSSLRGYKLLRLEPGAAEALVKFLDAEIKLRPNEWEPRYNQVPIHYSDIQTVRRQQPEDKKAQEKKAEEKKAEDKKAEEKKSEVEKKPSVDSKSAKSE